MDDARSSTRNAVRATPPRPWRWAAVALAVGALTAYAGYKAYAPAGVTQTKPAPPRPASADVAVSGVVEAQGATQQEAVRLAHQVTFGPTEALVATIKSRGITKWLQAQLAWIDNPVNQASLSRYTSGGDDSVDKLQQQVSYCNRPEAKALYEVDYCNREFVSGEPLVRDFYRNATNNQGDQLRQRMALALANLLIVSSKEVGGTYAMRIYQNMLLEKSLTNYRDVLREVILSPLMGDYLDHVNNDPQRPNENFARELMELFSIGPCQLNHDGTLVGGECAPTYGNQAVQANAYALTGWTYPPGGTRWVKARKGIPAHEEFICHYEFNFEIEVGCRYYGQDNPSGRRMVEVPALRDLQPRTLIGGVLVPANTPASAAVELVLDALMQHPNVGPFIGTRLIQHFVKSNPTPKYVDAVATAFDTGIFTSRGVTIGSGLKGDLRATLAAILMHPEARSGAVRSNAGALRQPALLIAGAVRAFNGITDGEPFGKGVGSDMRQQMHAAPSVFSYFLPDFPVAATSPALSGPEFGILDPATVFARLNYLNRLFPRGGWVPSTQGCDVTPRPLTCIPDALGTSVDFSSFHARATSDVPKLVDDVALMLIGEVLPEPQRALTISAVLEWDTKTDPDDWVNKRVAAAAYIVMSSPDYQVQR